MRRYLLFLLVAILTFVMGVASAALIGGVALFPQAQTDSSSRRCSQRRLSSIRMPKRSLSVYTFYRSDGTLLKSYEVDRAYGLERLGMDRSEAAPQTSVIRDASNARTIR